MIFGLDFITYFINYSFFKEAIMADHDSEFRIERIFDAPREKVWQAWTDGTYLKEWFGPKGCPIDTSHLDLRANGSYHYSMKMPNGSYMWGRWVFLKIDEPNSLEFIASFSDESGKNVTRNPWSATWPLQMLSRVVFTDMGGKTKISMSVVAHEASAEEVKTFTEGHSSMNQGWSGTFEQLDTYLKTQK